MVVTEASVPGPQGLLREDDEVWLRSVLDLVPRSVYGDESSHAGLKENSEKGTQKREKRKPPSQKKRRASDSKSQRKENGDGDDTERAGLREKLHGIISEKRSERKADEESYSMARAARKRKRDEKSSPIGREGKRIQKGNKRSEGGQKKAVTKKPEGDGRPDNRNSKPEDISDAGISVTLETTRISGFSADKPAQRAKRRKLGVRKLLELQKQLTEVNREQELRQKTLDTSAAVKQLVEGKTGNGPELNANDLRSREMDKAMQRAQGIDVKDDAKKLKKSIRREKRKSEKSKEEWAKRRKTQDMEQTAKQEKRVRNLAERKNKRVPTTKQRLGKK